MFPSPKVKRRGNIFGGSNAPSPGSFFDENSRQEGVKVADIKPSHVGRLHEHLGIPLGEKIPLAKLMQAKQSPSPSVRKMATYAINVRT